MNSIIKTALTLVLNLIVSIPLYASLVEKNSPQFPIETETLLKGQIDYYATILPPLKMAEKYPDLFEIDSLSLFNEPNVNLVFTKAVYIVSKPVGFFDDKQMTEENFVKHMMGEQKVKRLSPETYIVTVPGNFSHSYKMQMFFDADDVSTLPNSKIIRAVGAAKRLDVISQGASSIMFSEFTNHTKFSQGGLAVTSFIPLKEEKTLVIQYQLQALKKEFTNEKIVLSGIKTEIQAKKNLYESFK